MILQFNIHKIININNFYFSLSNVQKVIRYEYHSILYTKDMLSFVLTILSLLQISNSLLRFSAVSSTGTVLLPLYVRFCFHLHFHFCTNVTLIELKLDWKYKAGVRQRNKAYEKKEKIVRIEPPALQYTIAIMRNISLGHHYALQSGCNLDCELDGKRTSTEEKRHVCGDQRMWMR